jgi:hypothetical protein
MEQDPPNPTPEAATDEPASSSNPTFETVAEELAWWTGVAEGMRRAGARPPADVAGRLKALRKAAAAGGDPFDFDPVPVRARHDGWTPRKQRGYVEGLADTGCASEAAARVGMTEQSANRLRRRPDARGFDIACEAALEFGLRGLRSVAWERAVKGVVQQIWYHGELKLPQLADELRQETISAVSVTGGHLGAGLGVVELTVALHYVFDTPRDRLIWDVGHQAYPHKIVTGRRDRIRTLRQGGGLSGFTKRSESEYDPFGAAHSSTSISAGARLRGRATSCRRPGNHAIAVIGDGAMSAGMAYEAMNNAGAPATG